MTLRTIVLTFVSLIFIANFAQGQQISRSTLHKYQQLSFNPAVAGVGGMGKAQLLVRNQFMGLPEGAGPQSTWLNFDMPIKKIKSGVGLTINQLSEGFEKRLLFKANYSYFIDFGSGELSLGLSAGVNSIGWNLKSPIYPDGTEDSFIQKLTAEKNYNNLIFGFGACYKTPNFYASLGITEINQPKLKLQNEKIDYFKRTFWLGGGYDLKTANPLWIIKPAAQIKTTFAATQLNFDLIAEYKSAIMGGITYSTSGELSPVLGLQFSENSKLDGLMAIISYDILLSKMNKQSAGNLEFMLSYSFTIGIEKENKIYKSVRFL